MLVTSIQIVLQGSPAASRAFCLGRTPGCSPDRHTREYAFSNTLRNSDRIVLALPAERSMPVAQNARFINEPSPRGRNVNLFEARQLFGRVLLFLNWAFLRVLIAWHTPSKREVAGIE